MKKNVLMVLVLVLLNSSLIFAEMNLKRPGIIVVHEWRGINDFAKKRAVDLAEEGFVAFALDMYGDGREIPMSEARNMSGRIGSDYPLIEKRFNAALDILKGSRYVDADIITSVLAFQGDGDPAAPYEKQQEFIAEMKESEEDFSYVIFGNVPAHNFTNAAGRSYHEIEAEMAWASMLTFFESIFE